MLAFDVCVGCRIILTGGGIHSIVCVHKFSSHSFMFFFYFSAKEESRQTSHPAVVCIILLYDRMYQKMIDASWEDAEETLCAHYHYLLWGCNDIHFSLFVCGQPV